MILSRLPMQRITGPECTASHRAVLSAITVPGHGPLIVADIHGLHHAPRENRELFKAVEERAQCVKAGAVDCILISKEDAIEGALGRLRQSASEAPPCRVAKPGPVPASTKSEGCRKCP